MLILLLLHHLKRVEALPNADPSNESSSSSLSCHDINRCRTLPHIVWSCLATILAFTWLSTHTNIPYPADKRKMNVAQRLSYSVWTLLKDRISPFVVALMIPEWTLTLAIQQCIVANKIAQRGGKGWTQAHGFFVIMGGFHAFRRHDEKSPAIDDHGEPCYPLDQDTVIELVNDGRLQLPSEEEIQDRSKSDWIVKTLVFLQTAWFVIQCIARGAAHLSVTKLEIVTLAYTIMNIGIYIAWWDKPRSVNQPLRVFLPDTVPPQKQVKKQLDWTERWVSMVTSLAPGGDYVYEVMGTVDTKTWKSVPIFYSGDLTIAEFDLAAMVASIVGIVFGGIHCLTWSFSFPSHTEKLLWQLSVTAMVSIPAFLSASIGFDMLYGKIRRQVSKWTRYILLGILVVSFNVAPFLGVLYVISRVLTLTLAFKSLTSLPIEAYETIPWTQWIPHI